MSSWFTYAFEPLNSSTSKSSMSVTVLSANEVKVISVLWLSFYLGWWWTLLSLVTVLLVVESFSWVSPSAFGGCIEGAFLNASWIILRKNGSLSWGLLSSVDDEDEDYEEVRTYFLFYLVKNRSLGVSKIFSKSSNAICCLRYFVISSCLLSLAVPLSYFFLEYLCSLLLQNKRIHMLLLIVLNGARLFTISRASAG